MPAVRVDGKLIAYMPGACWSGSQRYLTTGCASC
jgi:hypothetical protein